MAPVTWHEPRRRPHTRIAVGGRRRRERRSSPPAAAAPAPASRRSAKRHAHLGVALVLLLAVAAPAALVAGCGGPSGGAVETVSSLPSATSASVTLSGDAATIASYAQTVPRLQEPGALDDLLALYADDARMEDRAYGATSVGKDQIRSYWTQYFAGGDALSYRVTATYLGTRCAVVESLACSPGVVTLPTAEIIMLGDGLITRHYVYYYDGQIGREAEPLRTRAAPGDTESVSLHVAKAYLAAIRATDVSALAALYAADVVYRDTAHDRSFAGAVAAAQAHAPVFAMKGIQFAGDEVLAGPGWAAVMWRRTDREGRQIAYPDLPDDYLRLAGRPTIAGVSVLEIRDGKIARETVYCDHLRTRL